MGKDPHGFGAAIRQGIANYHDGHPDCIVMKWAADDEGDEPMPKGCTCPKDYLKANEIGNLLVGFGDAD